jgi:FlaG/FlaF family flagellin (archaellin)
MFVNAEGTIHISNDYPADVQLQAYVTAGCGESYDMGFSLTANQITAFSSDDLAAPFGDGPDAVSMYVWAVNNDNAQIRWNHLSGGIIEGSGAYASAAALQGNNGDAVGVAGTINMDGVEYSSAYNGYTVNFKADTGRLSIDLLDHDFADKDADAPNTKIVAEIWNSNEVKFSGTSQCVTCASSERLEDWSSSAVNFFRGGSLGTTYGKARLSTEANSSCGDEMNPSEERAFLAAINKGSAAGTGSRSATITYELTSEPEEAGKVRKAFGLLRK